MKKLYVILMGIMACILMGFLVYLFIGSVINRLSVLAGIEEYYQAGEYKAALALATISAARYPGDDRFGEWILKCEDSLEVEWSSKNDMEKLIKEIIRLKQNYPNTFFSQEINALKLLFPAAVDPERKLELESKMEEIRKAIEEIKSGSWDSQIRDQEIEIRKLRETVAGLSNSIDALKISNHSQSFMIVSGNNPKKEKKLITPSEMETIRTLTRDAVAFFYKGDYSKSEAGCNRIMQIDEGNPVAHLFYGATLFQTSRGAAGFQEKIIYHLKKALEGNAELVLSHFYLGKVYQLKELYSAAITEFLQYVLKEDNDERAYFALGQCYVKLRKYVKAVESYEKAVALSPLESVGYRELGLLYREMNNPDLALGFLEKVIKIDPLDFSVLLVCAEIKEEQKSWLDALSLYEKAYSLDERPFILFRMGECARKAGRTDAAIDYFTEVIEDDGTNWDAYYELGIIKYNEGSYREAMELFQYILLKNPEYTNLDNVHMYLSRLPLFTINEVISR